MGNIPSKTNDRAEHHEAREKALQERKIVLDEREKRLVVHEEEVNRKVQQIKELEEKKQQVVSMLEKWVEIEVQMEANVAKFPEIIKFDVGMSPPLLLTYYSISFYFFLLIPSILFPHLRYS